MNPINPVGDKPTTNFGLWSAGILFALLIIVMIIVNSPVQASHSSGEIRLFTPIAEASLDKINVRQLCVTTLRTQHFWRDDQTQTNGVTLTEPETFCTDFHNVHVYADEKR